MRRPRRPASAGVAAFVLVMGAAAGCAPGAGGAAAVHKPALLPAAAGLRNLYRLSPRVLSGSAPETAADFRALVALGVKTVLSVDGARPRVEAARAEGLRYVHIPVGYDGVAPAQQVALARAVRDLPGGVYIHCHHGQHRGPAAAASALILLGQLTSAAGVAFLHAAGTSTAYPGLYRCVTSLAAAAPGVLEAGPVDLPEVSAVAGTVRAMVEVQSRLDHLEEMAAAGWRAPPSHPDLVPVAEAAELEGTLRGLLADGDLSRFPGSFRLELEDARARAGALERALAGRAPAAELDAHLERARAACAGCHTRHRNPPTGSPMAPDPF